MYGGSPLGSDGYKRPEQTYQDKLTDDDVAEKLFNYDKVSDIYKVPLGTHLRYFVIVDNDTTKFRLGGYLYRVDGLPDYVILSNGGRTWSVQTKTAVFYQKKTQKQLVDEMKELKEEIELLKQQNKELKNLAKEYKKDLKECKKELKKYID